MEDTALKIVGSVKVHQVFNKKMGPKEYRMASIDLYDDKGTFVDTGTVFVPDGVEVPTVCALSFYKGQLSVKVS